MKVLKVHRYRFAATMWKHQGAAGWYFVTLPEQMSHKIRVRHGGAEEGWGRLRVRAQLKQSSWNTAVWFDTKRECYLLPIKSVIRKKLGLKAGGELTILLHIDQHDAIAGIF